MWKWRLPSSLEVRFAAWSTQKCLFAADPKMQSQKFGPFSPIHRQVGCSSPGVCGGRTRSTRLAERRQAIRKRERKINTLQMGLLGPIASENPAICPHKHVPKF